MNPPSSRHQQQRTRHVRRDYADIPPPTPQPDDSEYEDFQQQQQLSASQRNSAVNLASFNGAYTQLLQVEEDQAPFLHLQMQRSVNGEQGEAVPTYSETMQRTASSTSTLHLRRLSMDEYDTSPSLQHILPALTSSTSTTSSSPSPPLANTQHASATVTASTTSSFTRMARSRPGITTAQYIADRAAAFTHKQNLKALGLNFLNARQHLALAMCRDVVLILPLIHAFKAFKWSHHLFTTMNGSFDQDYLQMLTTASPSEYLITGVWCVVAAYLSYNVIDGLMVRWIVTYQTSAAIVRVLSMSMFLITIELVALSLFSPGGSYSLHTWILISLVLTGAYIAQSFVTSNLDLKDGNRRRTMDYYSIAVFAVVPVGLASFISMVGLLRALLIIRLDLNGKAFLEGLFG